MKPELLYCILCRGELHHGPGNGAVGIRDGKGIMCCSHFRSNTPNPVCMECCPDHVANWRALGKIRTSFQRFIEETLDAAKT